MARIIKDLSIVDDSWQTLVPTADSTLPTSFPSIPANGDIVITVAQWKTLDAASRDALATRAGRTGIEFEPADEPADIASELSRFALVAVRFPAFADGRGYSTARLLRERYGYTGELRAVGDIQRDQMFYLARCGFNSFAVREDKNIEDALNAFRDFSVKYQISVEEKQPLFRRRSA